MGMDYKYAGSASYPRFDREIKDLAKLFKGYETEELKHRAETENERPFGYWFGYMSSADSNMEKYVFPKDTNKVLVKWFNHIYENFTPEETEIIFNEIKQYKSEVEEISDQVYQELKELYEMGEGWYIN